MRALVKSAGKRLAGRGCRVFRLHRRLHRDSFVILCYHRILPDPALAGRIYQPGMITPLGSFRRQIEFVSRNYEVLPLAEMVRRYAEERFAGDRPSAVVTFDDGWRDNFDHALPELERYGIPATIFLATGFVGTGRSFWPQRLARLAEKLEDSEANARRIDETAARHGVEIASGLVGCVRGSLPQRRLAYDALVERGKRSSLERIERWILTAEQELGFETHDGEEMLGWKEVRAMGERGISFGSHGHDHAILTGLGRDAIGADLAESRATFVREGVECLPVFCYPNGSYDPGVIDAVRAGGFTHAVTTRRGAIDRNHRRPFELNRVGVHMDIGRSVDHFVVHVLGLLSRRDASPPARDGSLEMRGSH